jgi:hypothetical protein
MVGYFPVSFRLGQLFTPVTATAAYGPAQEMPDANAR